MPYTTAAMERCPEWPGLEPGGREEAGLEDEPLEAPVLLPAPAPLEEPLLEEVPEETLEVP